MMTSALRWNLLLMAGIAVFTAGCWGSTPAAKPTPDPTTTPPQAPDNSTPANPAANPQKGAEPAPPVRIEDNSAAAAVTKTLRAMEAGNLAEAYDFLPPVYQADVDSLLHEFAEKMDADVWSSLIETSRKSIEVLKTKKDMILALDLIRDRPEAGAYRKHWDAAIHLLETLAQSDAADLKTLKQIKAESLLPGKASPILQQLDAIGMTLGANLARQFAGMTVTPVRSEGAVQIVAIRGPGDEMPTEFEYVQHDGRWLPKTIVEHWNEGIASDREWLAKLPERIKVVKPRLLDALSQANQVLDQLQAATNREEFERAAGPAILSLAMTWPGIQSMARQAMSGQTEAPAVTISINRELTDAELTKLVTEVLTPLRESGSDYTLLANDGRTLCRLVKITDSDALRARLESHFNVPADDVQLDRQTSTIKVELVP